MKLSKYSLSLSLLAFCLFFNIGVAEAKVCLITDPNCNAPLDFTMPDCEDPVVKAQFPKRMDADCSNCGVVDKTSEKYPHGDCWKSCRPETCADAQSKGYIYAKYSTGFTPCPDGQEVDPDTKHCSGDCYKACKPICSDGYTFIDVPLTCSDGQKEETQSGTDKEKCKRCTGTECESGYATTTTAAFCVDGQTLASQSSNTLCKKCEGVPCESGYSTSVTCPSGTLLSQPSNTACKQCNEPVVPAPAGCLKCKSVGESYGPGTISSARAVDSAGLLCEYTIHYTDSNCFQSSYSSYDGPFDLDDESYEGCVEGSHDFLAVEHIRDKKFCWGQMNGTPVTGQSYNCAITLSYPADYDPTCGQTPKTCEEEFGPGWYLDGQQPSGSQCNNLGSKYGEAGECYRCVTCEDNGEGYVTDLSQGHEDYVSKPWYRCNEAGGAYNGWKAPNGATSCLLCTRKECSDAIGKYSSAEDGVIVEAFDYNNDICSLKVAKIVNIGSNPSFNVCRNWGGTGEGYFGTYAGANSAAVDAYNLTTSCVSNRPGRINLTGSGISVGGAQCSTVRWCGKIRCDCSYGESPSRCSPECTARGKTVYDCGQMADIIQKYGDSCGQPGTAQPHDCKVSGPTEALCVKEYDISKEELFEGIGS